MGDFDVSLMRGVFRALDVEAAAVFWGRLGAEVVAREEGRVWVGVNSFQVLIEEGEGAGQVSLVVEGDLAACRDVVEARLGSVEEMGGGRFGARDAWGNLVVFEGV